MTTKASIVTRVVDATGLSKRAAAQMIDTVTGIILNDVLDNGVAVIPGVGKLRVSARPERQGRNPRTGEALTIPARKVVRFRPAASVKRAVQD